MHKKIWFKIHLYLGLTAGIILMVMGITGAMISFQKEILWLVNKDSYIVKVSGQMQTEQQIIDNFRLKFPKANIRGLTVKNDPTSSAVVNIASNKKGKAGRRGINYYINPYTSEILPNVEGQKVFKFIEMIHRGLVAGEVGKQIVGACTLALLILMLSGVFVYLPRLKRAFFKSFTFKFKQKGRSFLSTMHSSLGMWVIPFYLVSSFTGLFLSYHWFSDIVYNVSGVEKKVRQKPTVIKTKRTENKNTNKKGELSSQRVQEIFNLFKENITDYSSVSLKFEGKKGIYNLTYIKKEPMHYRARNEISLDMENNTIVKHEEFSKKPLEEILIKSVIPIHTGEYFGRTGQILMLIASLLMSLFTITGFMMYFQRRKKKY
ncbi:PepSY-associated TM helix domain-containing protein [Poseidonibacter ostreae]|uniref:PepSY domain-containing protein n=1 Tax=Poseidonibacter ostreae TaxID=2654171 RepID=A0A6L4WU98_9BACT|nr:PepSY-associated TM helix domain-containing protein [Poseidonibacter ostreae]KAB7888158.1 PepSY domain-containing protein [Poseidonibacter ostreae]KAB7892067.1 PepSY domain-containing protein [Poseidonibacter ostreae]MAC84869.1 sulfite reductase [Arcobacter sp.]|tara:strand:- start:4117 stop:5244 length:1128 start_codon:yes stop_codon:yes gene_type:complete